MKALFVSILIAATSLLQTNTYPEPDFVNSPVWYDPATKALKAFERAPGNQAARATGMYSSEVYVIFAGESSPVKFAGDKLPPILVKMANETQDPGGVVELAKLQVNKRRGQREYIVKQQGLGSAKGTLATVMIDFKRVAGATYEIIPANPLEPGEYALGIGKKGFLFSVE